MTPVSETKGAPCARHAHFHGRVHDFRRCAHGVYTFFEPVIIARIKRVHEEIPGRTVSGEVHPVGAINKTLISDTGHLNVKLRGGGGGGGGARGGPVESIWDKINLFSYAIRAPLFQNSWDDKTLKKFFMLGAHFSEVCTQCVDTSEKCVPSMKICPSGAECTVSF